MMSNDEKPLEDAITKYDAWIRNRQLEKFGDTDEHEQGVGIGVDIDSRNGNGKRKRPTTFQDRTTGGDRTKKNGGINQQHPDSTKKRKISDNSPVTPSPKLKLKIKKAAAKHANANANAVIRPNHVISASILQTATIAEHHAEYNNTTSSNDASNSDEEDDNDEHWNGMYERLKAFHSEHGHCKVPKSKHPELAYWTLYTRRRIKLEATRSGARALTLREEKLLNDLDFDPVYKEIVTEFNKYLGMRVAKLFDVWDDFGSNDNDNDNENDNASTSSPSSSVPISNLKVIKQHKDEIRDAALHAKNQTPRITTKPFFGTVGRISSVCNRYLRIKYDDGDREDFDMAGLLEGLEMYNKYKDKDTLRGVVANTVPTPITTPSVAITATTAADVDVGNSMDKDDSNEEKKDDDNKMINKISRNSKDIGSSSDANQNKTNNPTAKSDNPDGKIDKSPPSDPIGEDSEKNRNANNALAASIHRSLGDEDAIAKVNVDHKSNIRKNNVRTYNGSVIKVTFTGRSGGSNSNNDDNKNDNDNINDNNNINDSDGGDSSSSSDEVEIVNVLTPYRGNPSLFGFPKL